MAGLSDLVVERLTKVDPDRIADRQRRRGCGSRAHPQPPGRREEHQSDYMLLGQLQRGENGLRSSRISSGFETRRT